MEKALNKFKPTMFSQLAWTMLAVGYAAIMIVTIIALYTL